MSCGFCIQKKGFKCLSSKELYVRNYVDIPCNARVKLGGTHALLWPEVAARILPQDSHLPPPASQTGCRLLCIWVQTSVVQIIWTLHVTPNYVDTSCNAHVTVDIHALLCLEVAARNYSLSGFYLGSPVSQIGTASPNIASASNLRLPLRPPRPLTCISILH